MLNLGILAHVDAGKTTLTERLLYVAGVIDEIGSVDAGTTQTDSLALERQRGITIKSAVTSFAVDGVTVNLIDTPGQASRPGMRRTPQPRPGWPRSSRNATSGSWPRTWTTNWPFPTPGSTGSSRLRPGAHWCTPSSSAPPSPERAYRR